ncbi:Dipeptidyl aminopeptidase BIII [Linum perenne]
MASLTIGLSLATFTFTRLPLPAPLALSSSVAFSCFRFRIQHTVFPKRHHSHHRFCSMASSVPAQEVATAPYGSWKSPITADLVSGASKRLGGTAVDSQGRLLVLESRPNEGGRSVLVRLAEKTGDDEPVDVTPKDFGVRTTCQEYGGGAFAVSGDTVIFSNYKDQRLYKQTVDGQDSMPVPLTPDYGGPVITYADGVFDYRFNRYLTVREDCRKSSTNGTTTIVSVGLNEKDIQEPTVLVGGNDFYAFPRLDPKGERMAWIEWGHPNMPWDKSELWVGYISEKGQKGRSYFSIVDDAQSSISLLDIPFTDIDNITSGNHCLYIEGASGISPSSVAKVTLDGHGSKVLEFNIVWSSSPDSLKYKSYFSLPEFIEFPTEVPGQNAYAYFYPPSNPDYQASQGEKPPLLLKSHGGPTAEARGILNMSVQYWTSRGWAFVDVNYGGSTGYGREYRERLLLKWGIVDVNDCCSCANFLVNSGLADGNRLCITGGSAGGYTTLAALAFKNTFKAGASLYGVADVGLLRAETHKFESHYIDNLVGAEKDYYERSPINFVDQFSCPIILFQGLDDKVVPPDQARKIYEALKKKGLPVALVEYEGEQHGFRKAENIKFTLEQQMVFFARLVGHFNVADKITPIKIENFDEK